MTGKGSWGSLNFAEPAVWFPAIRCGSGVDVFTERLVEGLRRRGLRAEITWLPHRAEYAPWTVTRPRPPSWANIVHVNTCFHRYLLPPNLPFAATVHHCVQDPALRAYKTPFQALYHRIWVTALEGHILANAALIVAVSRYTAVQARTLFGCEGVEVIHNGIDLDQFHSKPRPRPHHPFRLLFVGNPTRRKGGDLLAPIMKRLGPNFVLYHTGGLGKRGAVSEACANIFPLERFSDTTQMVKLYQDADALLFPSRLEGFGLAALEAQACGVPVVATRGSALPEVIEDGVTGWLCAANDVAEFTVAIQSLAADEELWRRMGTAARQRAEALFSQESMVDRYVAGYRKVLFKT